jgi:hypothetical protein
LQQSCTEYLSNSTVTITINGQAEPMNTVPCQFGVFTSNQWGADHRYLSPPLSPGTYTVNALWSTTAPIIYESGCSTYTPTTPCYATDGPFTVTLTVS